jgi:hypothetical protein
MSNSLEFDISFSNAPTFKLPPLKKKIVKKKEAPHFSNVNVPMSEKEINEFKKKYPNRKIIYKTEKPPQSEQIELKNIYLSSAPLEITDIYNNAPDIMNNDSIVGDPYLEEDRTNNYIKGYFYHKLGNCHSFLSDKKGNPLIIVGKKIWIYFLITLVLHFIFWFHILYFRKRIKKNIRITGIVFICLFQIIYSILYLINPGFPKNNLGRNKGIPTEQYKYCSECLFYYNISRKVNHCFTCGICVEGFVRHSIFINKCVGKKNFILFNIFLIFLATNIILIIIIICFSYK